MKKQVTVSNKWVPPDSGVVDKRDPVADVLIKRGEAYGPAWRVAGEVLAMLHTRLPMALIWESAYVHNWMQLLGKVIRLMSSPAHHDSWQDIEGYARLVREELEANDEGN